MASGKGRLPHLARAEEPNGRKVAEKGLDLDSRAARDHR